MMRSIGVLLLVVPLTAAAQTVTTGSGVLDRTDTPIGRVPTDSAVRLMAKYVESVEWDEKPFEDVIQWLRDEADGTVNVIPKWSTLTAEGADRDAFVTLTLNYTTIGEVLAETLDSLSEDGEITFHAWGNKLKISTKGDFDRKLYLRVYDMTDVIFRVPNLGQGAPQIDIQRAGSGGGGAGGGGNAQIFGGGGGGGGGQERGGQQAEQDAEQRLDELVTSIQRVIAPETWSNPGQGQQAAVAGRGSIVRFNLQLIVVNTIEVHELLAGKFSLGG